jgi:hypothetical protein
VCCVVKGALELKEYVVLTAWPCLIPCAANGASTNVIDVFNVTANAWSTAVLSVARTWLAATSLPNHGIAIFAGGNTYSSGYSFAVDIFNVTTNAWSTAVLLVARDSLAATSLPNLGLSFFAGGQSALLLRVLHPLQSGLHFCFVRGMLQWGGVLVLVVCTCLIPRAVGSGESSAVDSLRLCSPGFYSIVGTTTCAPCGPGRANPYIGQVVCACCAAGSFANVSGLSQCFPCTDTSGGCKQPCTSNPSCSCSGGTDCDVHRCAAGCTFRNETCQQAPAGYYTQCSTPSNCSAAPNELVPCARGSYSPAVGASSNVTCTDCEAGSYCPKPGTVAPAPCKAGSFSKSGALLCEHCAAGTFSEADRSPICGSCSAGYFCPEGSSQPCICPIYSFSFPGADKCRPCLGQATPFVGQSECVSLVVLTDSYRQLYWSIIAIFCVISFGSVALVVILVRSRHAFSVRPFHSGICIYVATFAPYALLKAVAVSTLLKTENHTQKLTADLMLSGTFMIFFCLGLGGKMALIQLWMHLISRFTASESEQSLMASARETWRSMRLTVLVVCVLYNVGFISLVAMFARASIACAASAADSTSCDTLSLKGTTPQGCQRQVDLTQVITYYEGIFAAIVAVVFTFYALMFNGLAYALLTTDSTFSDLTKLQRILISNKFLRWMMSPYERAHYRCAAPCM